MKKSLTASKKLMQHYLSELLTEDSNEVIDIKAEETEKLNKLFQNASPAENIDNLIPDTIVSHKSVGTKMLAPNNELALDKQLTSKIATKTVSEEKSVVVNKTLNAVADKTASAFANKIVSKSENYKNNNFQAMFFDVAGLTVAVPLIELGGIYNVDKITNLVGKPKWFEGVMIHRDKKINVVDTALWVMPEKYNPTLKASLNYQYIIMLSDSNWGLLAENLVDTVTLSPEDVKWVDSSSKRPWLAGLVKDRMCALLEVGSLIQLLNDGIDIKQT